MFGDPWRRRYRCLESKKAHTCGNVGASGPRRGKVDENEEKQERNKTWWRFLSERAVK